MTRFLAQHPVMLCAALILTVGMVAAYPWLLIPLAMAPTAWYGTRTYDRKYQARATHQRMLNAHADYEHWLTTNGHPAGMYGQYPPAVA